MSRRDLKWRWEGADGSLRRTSTFGRPDASAPIKPWEGYIEGRPPFDPFKLDEGCMVKKFVYPSKIESAIPERSPDGSVRVQFLFKVEAEFENVTSEDPPVDYRCKCCRFRQLVKSRRLSDRREIAKEHAEKKALSASAAHDHYEDALIVNPHFPQGHEDHEIGYYHEVASPGKNKPKREEGERGKVDSVEKFGIQRQYAKVAYGARGGAETGEMLIIHNPLEGYFDDASLKRRNRVAGCFYDMLDGPSFLIYPGEVVVSHWWFKGIITKTCPEVSGEKRFKEFKVLVHADYRGQLKTRFDSYESDDVKMIPWKKELAIAKDDQAEKAIVEMTKTGALVTDLDKDRRPADFRIYAKRKNASHDKLVFASTKKAVDWLKE